MYAFSPYTVIIFFYFQSFYSPNLDDLEASLQEDNKEKETSGEGNNSETPKRKYLFKIRKTSYDRDLEPTATVEISPDSQIYTIWTKRMKEEAFKSEYFEVFASNRKKEF